MLPGPGVIDVVSVDLEMIASHWVALNRLNLPDSLASLNPHRVRHVALLAECETVRAAFAEGLGWGTLQTTENVVGFFATLIHCSKRDCLANGVKQVEAIAFLLLSIRTEKQRRSKQQRRLAGWWLWGHRTSRCLSRASSNCAVVIGIPLRGRVGRKGDPGFSWLVSFAAAMPGADGHGFGRTTLSARRDNSLHTFNQQFLETAPPESFAAESKPKNLMPIPEAVFVPQTRRKHPGPRMELGPKKASILTVASHLWPARADLASRLQVVGPQLEAQKRAAAWRRKNFPKQAPGSHNPNPKPIHDDGGPWIWLSGAAWEKDLTSRFSSGRSSSPGKRTN